MFLLLAAGVFCAPPLELVPDSTPAPPNRLETTQTSLPYIDSTTSVVTNVETSTQKKLDSMTTETEKLQETTAASASQQLMIKVKQIEEIVQVLTTELPIEAIPAKELTIEEIPVTELTIQGIPAKELSTTTTPATTTTMKIQPLAELSTTSKPAPTQTPAPITTPAPRPPYVSAKEREALISYLGNVDLTKVDKLILNQRQQLAITQELEHQQLGLTPFTDPTPWQRLTRDQQKEFNRKYLALRKDLQEFSRNKFLSLSEEMQEHAYNAFLSFDINTLAEVIGSEMNKEREAAEIQRLTEEREIQRIDRERQQQRQRDFQQQQRNTFKEQPRSQQGNKLNSLNFNHIEKSQQIQTNRQRPNFDPRRTQQRIQQNPFKKRQYKQQLLQQQQASFERLHFQTVTAQLQEAVRLQGCLANPSLCRT